MTYTSFFDCVADSWTEDTNISEENDSWYAFKLESCNSLSIWNCSAVESAKGLYMDTCSNIEIANCQFDLPYMTTSSSPLGTILSAISTTRISLSCLYVTNWKCTGWTTAGQGWLNASGAIKIRSLGNQHNKISLHDVSYRGYDRDVSLSGHTEIHQALCSALINVGNSQNSRTDVIACYDWPKGGPTSNRPIGLDSLIGSGYSYFNTDSGQNEVWNGTMWVTM